MPSISEMIDLFFAELRALGYQAAAVMKVNHITDDEDLILFAINYLGQHIDNALIEDREKEIQAEE